LSPNSSRPSSTSACNFPLRPLQIVSWFKLQSLNSNYYYSNPRLDPLCECVSRATDAQTSSTRGNIVFKVGECCKGNFWEVKNRPCLRLTFRTFDRRWRQHWQTD
jgi:hypothetical protein